MGFLADVKKKLGKAVDEHGDQISSGIDKAAQAIDKKTGGKYADKIDSATDKAKSGLDGLDGKKDDFRRERPMTTSDAPQPPGGPTRQDGAEGDFAPDAHESGTAGEAGADGSDRQRDRPGESGSASDNTVPDVDGDQPEQDTSSAYRQEQNAETSTDQPLVLTAPRGGRCVQQIASGRAQALWPVNFPDDTRPVFGPRPEKADG